MVEFVQVMLVIGLISAVLVYSIWTGNDDD